MKAQLLRLHRWMALVFALPLIGIIGTGLVLSIEPLFTDLSARAARIPLAAVEAALDRHDVDGRARSLTVRAGEGVVLIGGGRGGTPIDVASGEIAREAGASASAFFGANRRIHERLFLGGGWLVTTSTVMMLVIVTLGILMGLPRIRNTPAGWHKATAWFLLPLVILSPATGLLLALGLSFTVPGTPPRGEPLSLRDALRTVARAHNLADVTWIRPQGSRMLARVRVDGELRVYAVTETGLVPQARNWPRLLHEGTFSSVWGSLINLLTSLALAVLLGTGLWIWFRRKLRRRERLRSAESVAV